MKNRLDAAPLNQLLHIALFESGINFWMSKGPWDTNHINSLSKLLVSGFYSLNHVIQSWLMNTLLPKSFALWNTLHPNWLRKHIILPDTLYSLAHLLISTLWSASHFNHRSTLLPGTLCSLEQFALWNNLKQSVPGSKRCWGRQFTN